MRLAKPSAAVQLDVFAAGVVTQCDSFTDSDSASAPIENAGAMQGVAKIN